MIAGVDGCRGGWFVAMAEAWPPVRPRLLLLQGFGVVLDATARCACVVVDMPIGLPSFAEHGVRQCDWEARKHLGRAASRVFNPLPRELLECADFVACNRRHRAQFGRGISRQSFGLRAKLLEMDRHMTTGLQRRVMEFHPELVWQRLHDGVPLPSKHTPAGLEVRKRLLRRVMTNPDAWWEEARAFGRGCKPDDVLDALVGLELASRLARNPPRARHLPQSPPCDARGLRMEIWF